MFFLDTSVVLAEILDESRRPPETLWREPLFASRLLEVEVWCALNRRNLRDTHGPYAQDLIDRVDLSDVTPEIMQRACQPVGLLSLRALDAIHVATMLEVRVARPLALASFDEQMNRAANVIGLELAEIG